MIFIFHLTTAAKSLGILKLLTITMKRIANTLLLLINLSLLVACGGSSAPDRNEPVAAESSEEITEVVPAPVTQPYSEAVILPAPIEVPLEAPSKLPDKEFGNILFNPPTQMTKGKTERIEVRISRDKEFDDTDLVGRGGVIKDEVRVSDVMSVTLYGEKFKIVSISDIEQIVEKTGYTQWSFDVTPLQAAQNQILTLKVTINIKYGDSTVVKNLEVYSKPINIDVDSKAEVNNFFQNNWKLLLGLLVLSAVAVFGVKRLSKKIRPKLTGDEAVFISYRRDDSSGYTLAIYDQLKQVFGDGKVFMDMDDIPHGEDFVEHIEKVLSKASTLLVMIGENWVNTSNAKGRRLDDPEDFVRLEVAKALDRDIRVIPVLLKNAAMPGANELPEELKLLARKNAIKIHDDQFDMSVQRLIDAIAV